MILLLIRVRGEGRKEKDLRIRGKRTERERIGDVFVISERRHG